jgi:DNA-binding MarR family transcriptional regulator
VLKKKRQPPARRFKTSDYALIAEFRYLLRKFHAFSEEAARKAGLSPQQHQALLAIKGNATGEQMSIGDLAERLSIRPHSAVGLVNRLVAAKLAIRAADPSDQRRVALKLSKEAEALLAGLTEVHRDELRRLAPVLRRTLKAIE